MNLVIFILLWELLLTGARGTKSRRRNAETGIAQQGRSERYT